MEKFVRVNIAGLLKMIKFAKGDLLLENETLFKILLKDYLDDFVKCTGYFKVDNSTVGYLVDNNEIEIFRKLVVKKGVTGNLYDLYEQLPKDEAWKFAWQDLLLIFQVRTPTVNMIFNY